MKEDMQLQQDSELLNILNIKYIRYLLALCIPLFVVLVIYQKLGIGNGNNLTLLTSDLNGQYVSYYAYLKSVFQESHNIFYTFSKTLGGNMIGLTGYYLLSPFNIVLLFYPLTRITTAIFIITVAKIMFSGLFFYLYLESRTEKKYFLLLFSTAYALMAYNFAFQMHLMWLDGVVLLPLIAFGIDKIFEQKSAVLYAVSLGLSIITCYYIGYMLCIFSVIYFIYKMIKEFPKGYIFKILMKYAIFSILGAGLSSVILIPSILSLQGSKEITVSGNLNLTLQFGPVDFLSKFYTSAYNKEQFFYGLPNIYCGILILILVLLFFLNRTVKVKEKAATVFVFAVLISSFSIKALDMVWHGFNMPNSFNYRYSFVFSFFLILIAFESLYRLREDSASWKYVLSGLLVIGGAVYVVLQKFDYISWEFILFDIGCTVLFCVFLHQSQKGDRDFRPIFLFLIFCLNLYALYSNGYQYLKNMDYFDHSLESYVDEVKPSVDFIKKTDSGFYRMEKDFLYSLNDPMLLSYNGLSHFSSTENVSVKEIMERLGYTRNGKFWAYYGSGSTLAADSLLGVKYVMSKDNVPPYLQPYNQQDTINTYYNPYALSIGVMADDSIVQSINYENNPFEYQNKVYMKLTGRNQNILTQIQDYVTLYDNTSVYIENNHYFFDRKETDKDAFIEYQITCRDSNPVYVFFNTDDTTESELYINDKYAGTYFDTYHRGVISLGSYQQGDVISFKIKLKGNKLHYAQPQFYYQDMMVFSEYISQLQQNSLYFLDTGESSLYGDITADENGKYLFLTIPYDKNWNVTIDGKKVKTVECMDSFMAVKLEKGNHQVRLVYIPAGLSLGLHLSEVSLLIIAFILLVKGIQFLKGMNNDAYQYL